jgi:3-dehydroquinate synthase
MDLIAQEFRVSFRYPVHFTRGVFETANPVLLSVLGHERPPRVADLVVVVDAGVAKAHPGLTAAIETYTRHHGQMMRLTAPVLIVPGGEHVKNDPRHLEAILGRIHEGGLCRHSYLVAVGGGAVLDAAGYAAATAHRGIRHIRIPTTVLSQDDSAMGVKNGVNAYDAKNYLGTFAPPYAVINDFDFLTTLEDRDWLGGVSEAIKAALIRDAAFFGEIERLASRIVARDRAAMEDVVRRSAALHLAHIAGGDPFELSSSRPLDFGHWAAHKLERLTLDTTYSWLTGSLSEHDWRRIVDLLQALNLAVWAPELSEHVEDPGHPRSIFRGLEEFREHLGGHLTVMLLEGIGRPFDVHEIDTGVMIRGIQMLRQIEAARVKTPVASTRA